MAYLELVGYEYKPPTKDGKAAKKPTDKKEPEPKAEEKKPAAKKGPARKKAE
jgi:hypothetical protein